MVKIFRPLDGKDLRSKKPPEEQHFMSASISQSADFSNIFHRQIFLKVLAW